MAEVLTRICYGLCAALMALSLSILAYINQEPVAAPPSEPIASATTAEATEPSKEPTVVTTPATEATEPPETQPMETEPPVMLYDVPLSEDLQLYIIELCDARGIDPAIVMAMIWRESSYRAEVIGDNGDSLGLMQIQKKWCKELMIELDCEDLLDPYQNVRVGVAILADKLEQYNGDIEKALVAYNAGKYCGAVTKYAMDVMSMAIDLNEKYGQCPDK